MIPGAKVKEYLRLGFKKIHKAQGNGWAVIEKEVTELNSDSAISPTDTVED